MTRNYFINETRSQAQQFRMSVAEGLCLEENNSKVVWKAK